MRKVCAYPDVVGRLAEAFTRDGYDGASLTTLSKATGLGKSSLYHYFPGGKVAMAHEVLDHAFASARREVFGPVTADGPAEKRLAEVLDRLAAFYGHGTKACVLGRLATSVDRHQFRPRLREIFGAQTAALTRLLIEARVPPIVARARAEDAVVSIQGALVLSGATGDSAPFMRVMARLRRDLLAPVTASPRRTARARRARR